MLGLLSLTFPAGDQDEQDEKVYGSVDNNPNEDSQKEVVTSYL